MNSIDIFALSILMIALILTTIILYNKIQYIFIRNKFLHLNIDKYPNNRTQIILTIPTPPRNEKKLNEIEDMKKDIIENINNYTVREINIIINKIVNIYIDNKCDFIEDYKSKILLNHYYKLQKKNEKYYRKLKRNIIINDIINKIYNMNKGLIISPDELRYKLNELNELFNEIKEYDNIINTIEII